MKEKSFQQILAEESPMTFAHYMELALYHPEYGYYARAPKIGKKGDYITAPTIHPVFGAAVARQILEIWHLLGKKEDFVICEAGAGEGYLALDILDFLSLKGLEFKYFILEPFTPNRLRQEEVLERHFDKVRWFSSWKEIPEFNGVFISNELFDSFPVHLVQKAEDELREVYVSFKETPKELLGELSKPALLERVSEFVPLWPEGYRTEVCLAYEPFFAGIAQKLSQGAIITFDYGYSRNDYYHEERSSGTLLCFQGHRVFANPYLFPGKCDLTAHVDFTAIKEIGEKFGFVTLGFTTQSSFLVSLGVEKLLAEIGRIGVRDTEALKMLLLPQGLGMSHWVLVQGRGLPLKTELLGFKLSNRLGIL
ncbi:class I SAM-dependent methyltransferase [Thermodesulfatator atlanticus]|uniref:class I SAM-dependent methyltransferase n=1 Tax=Thermodesulfatator atlanticus TaxID=501497 RepID=UPI0003B6A58C|nr:SAM-dependent methyltransferase [Thermodesulfatator atlanticus]